MDNKRHGEEYLEIGPPQGSSNPLLITKKAKKTIPPPPGSTQRFETSDILSKVKNFLPQMQKADEKLKQTIEQEGKERLQVEITDNETDKDYVEMNIGIIPDDDQSWTEDSDPDSPPLPHIPGHNNGFTSDTDSDSTISTSSGSDSSHDNNKEKAKKSIIQEINTKQVDK